MIKKFELLYDPRLMPDEDAAYKFVVPLYFSKNRINYREGLIEKISFLSIKALKEGDDPQRIFEDIFGQYFWTSMKSEKDAYDFATSLLSCDYIYNIINQANEIMEGELPERFNIIGTDELERIYSGTNLEEWLYVIYCE
jgi:hypothetical protein